MLSKEKQMDVLEAYDLTRSLRAAASAAWRWAGSHTSSCGAATDGGHAKLPIGGQQDSPGTVT